MVAAGVGGPAAAALAATRTSVASMEMRCDGVKTRLLGHAACNSAVNIHATFAVLWGVFLFRTRSGC